MPKGKKKGNKGHGHVWQKDDEQNECDDCGTLVDTWCLHCEACSHCDELGNGYPCKKAEMEQWLQEEEAEEAKEDRVAELQDEHRDMSKSHLKKALKAMYLETSGTREELIERLVEAIADGDEMPEIDEAEAAQIAAENAAKEAALQHMLAVRPEYAEMKAPDLRKELQARGLSDDGKKAELMERLAAAVEEESATGGKKDKDKKGEGKEKKGKDKKSKDKKGKKKGKDGKGLSKKDRKKYAKMSKSHLKKALKKQGLSTDGSRDELIQRLVEAIAAGSAEVPVIDEAEASEMAAENAAKDAAVQHMLAVKAEYADMKAPELREELRARGLSLKGKKAELLERLATALEQEMSGSPGPEKADRQKYDNMSKSHLKKALKAMYLETSGTKEELIERLVEAIADGDEMPEIDEAEAAQIAAENAAKEAALQHMLAVRPEYAEMKAPDLRKELQARGLSDDGKKAELMERLAAAVEGDSAAESKAAKAANNAKVLEILGEEYADMKADALRKVLKKRGLDQEGKK
eukprot:COSAG06_NODE_1244_length_10117_cov_130.600619_3_plen_521_part_01